MKALRDRDRAKGHGHGHGSRNKFALVPSKPVHRVTTCVQIHLKLSRESFT